MTIAKLPLAKDIEDFDFTGSGINETLVKDLAAGNFLAHERNVVLIGGTGKTHLASAIGARGRFFNVVDLVNKLEAETRAGRQGRMTDYLSRTGSFLLDELGYLPFGQSDGQLLLQLISRFCEQTSAIVSTNLPFDEWPASSAMQERPQRSSICSPTTATSSMTGNDSCASRTAPDPIPLIRPGRPPVRQRVGRASSGPIEGRQNRYTLCIRPRYHGF